MTDVLFYQILTGMFVIGTIVLAYQKYQLVKRRNELLARVEKLEAELDKTIKVLDDTVKPYQTKDEAFFLAEPDK